MAVRIEHRDDDDDDVLELVSVAGSFAVASVYSSSFAAWVAPTSDAWMLAPMATTALCAAAIRRASSDGSVRGSASRWLAALIRSRLRMFLGRRDDRGDRAMALGRRAEIDHLDAIRSGGDELERISRWRPPAELPIGAHAEAEMRFRCGHAACGSLLSPGDAGEEQDDGEQDEGETNARRTHRGIITNGEEAIVPGGARLAV